MRFVSAGIGLGTRDQLRVSGTWGHRNLWGRGKRAEIGGLVATEFIPKTDLVRTKVETRYVEPWLFGTRTTGTAELFYERSREFSAVGVERIRYDLDLVGLTLNANRDLTRHTNAWVALRNEWANVDAGELVSEEADLVTAPDVTRSISTQIQRDRRNDYFNPERGFFNRIIGNVSGGILGGDNDFWQIQVEASWYRSTGFIGLAGRLRVGYGRPFGQSVVDGIPDRDRFKLGGESTVRAYKEQEIGPGDFMMLGNAEARFPLFWILHAALFLDGGNAWDSPSRVSWRDFRFTEVKEGREPEAVRYAYRIGIRLGTPVGPVRLDYGRKLKILRSDEKTWKVHLSLGHVF
jgi:outer membrane protein insertion porin family